MMRGVVQRALRAGWVSGLCLLAAGHAWAQGAWRSDKPTELIVTTSPGGSNDLVTRLMQKILQDAKLLATPSVVVNRPGGNQTLAVAYLNQHPGDGHYLLMGNSSSTSRRSTTRTAPCSLR